MRAEDSGPPFLPEPVAFAPDIQDVAVVEQPVQDGRGNDGVPQELTLFHEAFFDVRMMLPPLVPGRHQGEEGGGGLSVVGPDAELVHDQHLGSQADFIRWSRLCSMRAFLRSSIRC